MGILVPRSHDGSAAGGMATNLAKLGAGTPFAAGRIGAERSGTRGSDPPGVGKQAREGSGTRLWERTIQTGALGARRRRRYAGMRLFGNRSELIKPKLLGCLQ